MLNVSIIVPIYRVEKYVSKCIESIINQTYSNWELLLIDDGSPDNSGKICDEYAQKDNRIKVIHKENYGVSSARNSGLDIAQGEYVMFVDSDDWISKDCLEVCVNEIKNNKLDALQFGSISIYKDKEILYVKNSTKTLSGEEYIKNNNFNVTVWGGIYKKNIIEKFSLRFSTQLKLAEDQIFILSYLKHVNRIKYINKAMYYYFQRSDSAIHTAKSIDILKSCDTMVALSKDWPNAKSFIDSMIILFIMDMIKNDDVPYSKLKSIFQKQNISKFIGVSKFQQIFPQIARINFHFACFLVKFYLRKF